MSPCDPGLLANRCSPSVLAYNRLRPWPTCETTRTLCKLLHLLALVTLVVHVDYRYAHDCCDNCLDSAGVQGGYLKHPHTRRRQHNPS